MTDGIFLGEGPHRAGDVGSAEGHGNAAKLLGQLEGFAQHALRGRVDAGQVFGWGLDVDGVPGGVEPIGDSRRLRSKADALGLMLETPTIIARESGGRVRRWA